MNEAVRGREERRSTMNARGKLNVAYVNGALILGTIFGLLTQSWFVFGFVLVSAMAISLSCGNIRPTARHR
jgi:hypothetical protein